MLSLQTSLPPFTLTGDFAGKSRGVFDVFMQVSLPVKKCRSPAFCCG